MARMEVEEGRCLAVSKDGRWIAAGMERKGLVVWNATTYKRAFSGEGGRGGVDFSPDATRLVSTGRWTGTIWNVASGKEVQMLYDEDACDPCSEMLAAKYSPQGDRIATASKHSVHVWDSNDGRLLLKINIDVVLHYNKGLHWRNDHLFVASNGQIQQFSASTGSKISEWLVPNDDYYPCFALPQHGGFITCSTEHSVTFWDTATRTQLSLIQYPHGIGSFAFSPDNRFFATGPKGRGGKITIQSLSHVAVSIRLV